MIINVFRAAVIIVGLGVPLGSIESSLFAQQPLPISGHQLLTVQVSNRAITLADGSLLSLRGGVILNSSITAEGSGMMDILAIGPWYGGLGGNITSNATIAFRATASDPSDLLFYGNTTLTGHTTLVTTDTLRNRVYGAGSGGAGKDTLYIPLDSQLTLGGSGQLDIINGGPFSPADEIINEGTISVLMKLARNDWPISNGGVIEIHNGAVLQSSRGIANAAGDITIHDGGVLRLVGGSISGGSVTTEGSGKIVIPSLGPFFGSISGNIASNATFSLESDGVSPADLIISATTILSGETRIVTTDTLRNRVFGTASLDTLTIATDSRLLLGGSGQLDFALPNQGGLESIANHGTFDVSMKLVKSALTVQNNGEVLIRGGAVLQVGPLTNVNAVLIEDAGRLELSGAFIQHNGETAVDGTLVASTVTLNDGVLSGNGTIMGNVSSLAATVAPGSSPGALHIDGRYTQGAAGSLILEIAGLLPGTEFDQLWVTGNASLAGSIDVVFTDGYLPRVGDVFDLMHVGGSFNASLAQLQVFNVPDVFQYTTAFENGAYSLTVTAVPEPSALLLASLGAAALAIVVRRRARRATATGRQAEGR